MIVLHPEVQQAIQAKQAVVALESTIISHGMPYPQNVEMAKQCEAIIRQNHAIPATIAILDGVLKIGLTADEIIRLGKMGRDAMKVSTRDIPYAISQKKTGALTVAATLVACDLAGIQFFATGGIGGVHRQAESTFDISTDLVELTKHNVCVVSAGMKSILDLPKTMEVCETLGVPVIGYQTNVLPAFFVATSNIPLEQRLDDPLAIASFLQAKWQLPIPGGVVIANPIPKEDSLEEEWINQVIQDALQSMEEQLIKGKDQTPYLLGEVVRLSAGKSLKANIALVWNNCHLASRIAVSYQEVHHETK